MRELVETFLSRGLSRRGFLRRMTALGFTAASAETVLKPLEASEQAGDPTGLSVPGAFTVEGTGADLMVAQAKAAGTRFLFTNPGSAEVGFFDAFLDSGIQLILGLHEGIVISMADGYHKTSRKPAFVNVHAIAGTAQMAGQLYNASRDGSALVVTAGLGDNELWNDDFILQPRPGFDQKEVNRQFTKISWEARQGESLALMTRRAFKVATTEPGGPVYLATAGEALEEKGVKGQILPAERFLIRGRIRADEEAIEKAALLLLEARRPLVVAGDEVWKTGAQDALVSLSETLGVAVGETRWPVYANFPSHHPHFAGGGIGLMQSEFASGVDLIVSVGARDFGGPNPPARPSVPPGATIVRIGLDTMAMGRTDATDLALVGDAKECLEDLEAAVRSLVAPARLDALARSRSDAVRAASSERRAAAEAEAAGNLGQSPMHPDELGVVMAETLDPDAVLVTENLTGRRQAFHFGHRDGEMMYLHNGGHALGWGVGAATGAKLGEPDRQVVCSIGDGSVMYSASGFWTQARYGIPVLTVVWNNHDYQIVRHFFDRYQGKMARAGKYPGLYLGEPDIDFAQLAKSQGLSAERVETAAGLKKALTRGIEATRSGTPYLIDVEIARYGGGAESTWHQEFNLAAERTRRV